MLALLFPRVEFMIIRDARVGVVDHDAICWQVGSNSRRHFTACFFSIMNWNLVPSLVLELQVNP